jgi:GTPase SAR1 family protein
MSEDIILKIKVVLKEENKVLTLLKNISKTENLKNIRDKNKKIIPEYQFCDGENLIDIDIEEDYEIGDLVDKANNVYVQSKTNINSGKNTLETSNISNISKDFLNNTDIQKELNELSISEGKEINTKENEKTDNVKKENEKKESEIGGKVGLNKDLLDFIQKLCNSKEDLKKKFIQTFEDNYLSSLEDLLNLKQEDYDIFQLPPLIKKKMIEEISKLKPKEELSEEDKKLIQTIFNQELPPDILFGSLGASSNQQKQEMIKNYYFSLRKPLKPIPNDLKKLIVKTSEDQILPCFKYPSHCFSSKRYYTLLVMGETGSGKTTLLDAFVNYLADMNYEDQWRYKLVDENHIKDLPPGASQTSEITSYYVNYQRQDGNEINVRIVDTPGLGDTGGVGKDNEIIKKFEKFFKTTTELDYILVTVKASTTRWTQNSQYVYDRVQEIFGKDAKNRFILMCTFADDKKPLAIKAIEGQLHYEEYFCFNNSALYTPSDLGQNTNTKFYWKLGMQNVKRFFDIILKKDLPPLSLTLTKQVMSKRNWLFINVQQSQKRVNEGFKMLDDSRELLEKIKKNKDLIDQNGSFKTMQKVKIPKTVQLDKTYQFCDTCKVMCCQICEWPPNETYSKCTYFDPNSCHYKEGGCPCCPGHCNRYAHVRANKYIVYDEREEEVVIEAKKKAFEEGQKGLSNSDILLNDTMEVMKKQAEEILQQMKEIKTSLEELDKIALKPRVLTNVEYFQQMIDFEKEQKKSGYLKRIEGLEMMKNQAEQLNAMSKAEDITQLFPSFNNTINELKNKSKSSCLIF